MQTIGMEQLTERMPEWAHNIILAGFRGSIVHGTYTAHQLNTVEGIEDDVDVFAVFTKDRGFYLGLEGLNNHNLHFNTNGEPLDIDADDLRRFIDFLVKGNPNSHMRLWLKPEHYFRISLAGEYLISNRDVFISRHILNAVRGHLFSQLKKGFNPFNRKAAAHALRLAIFGVKLANTTTIQPWLEGDELARVMAIKLGRTTAISAERQITEYVHRLQSSMDTSLLPERVDPEEANNILLTMLDMIWS
jgi:predicted nucleotidyltransferase